VFRPETPVDTFSLAACVASDGEIIFGLFSPLSSPRLMTESDQKLTPAEPDDLANSLSFALRFEGA
jgi:hypothetical protein